MEVSCLSCLENIGKEVFLKGWLVNKRDHGALLFLELRDHTGMVQLVCSGETKVPPVESVVFARGIVHEREKNNINENIPTGKIEIKLLELEVFSSSAPLPFEIEAEVSENLKLTYRFLYLRSKKAQENLRRRSEVLKTLREYMYDKGFLEVQTPLLSVETPEGARSFLVPSRLHKEKFYALPQAPQLYKQLLMVGGLNKYFQIAPCFRDEDARKDRTSGEFYQLDFEMSFVDQDQVIFLLVDIVKTILEKFKKESTRTYTRMSYKEALNTYGTDKPDLTYETKLEDFTEFFRNNEFSIYRNLIERGAIVKGIRCKPELKELDGEKEIGYVYKKNGQVKGSLGKFFQEVEEGQMVVFFCGSGERLLKRAGTWLKKFNRYEERKVDFAIVIVDQFPMFEKTEEGWDFTHNPFSKPESEVPERGSLTFEQDLEKVLALQYDLVLNGYELASGSIRNCDREKLIGAFEICGHRREDVLEKFKCILSAFQYGPPPHGGAAIGIERLLMILLGEDNVREVCAFPLNTAGIDPMTGAPTYVEKKALDLLGITTCV